MSPRAFEPLRLTAEFWQRDDVVAALDTCDIGELFRLMQKRAGATQGQIARAVGSDQPQVSKIMRAGPGQRRVNALDLLTRIADGLDMPDHARKHLGLAHTGADLDATPPDHPATAQPSTVLAHLIHQHNQTYEEAAADLDITPRHLARLARRETNAQPHPATRRALQAKYGLTTEQLLSPWTAPATPHNPVTTTPRDTTTPDGTVAVQADTDQAGMRRRTLIKAQALQLLAGPALRLAATASDAESSTASHFDNIPWTQDGAAAVAHRLSSGSGVIDGEAVSGPALTTLAHEWLLVDPEPLQAVENGGRIGLSTVNALGLVVDDFRRRDDEEGGNDLLYLVEPAVQLSARLISRGSYSEAVGKALHVRLAELAQLAGWAAFDAGLHRRAQGYLEAALRASSAADDRILGAYILSSLGFQATDIGKPLDGVKILRSAATGVRNLATPMVYAVLSTWEARAYARAGERRSFERALVRASKQYEMGARPDDPDWAYWMIQPELTAEAGRSFALIGDTDNATKYLEQGMESLGAEYSRDRALYTSYLAETYLLDDQLDGARRYAREAKTQVRELKSSRAAEHLETVERRLD